MNRKDRYAAINAVDNINKALMKKYGGLFEAPLVGVLFCEDFIFFSVSIPNTTVELKLNGIDDDRIYNEKKDTHEDWESYIKRKFRLIMGEISEFKI